MPPGVTAEFDSTLWFALFDSTLWFALAAGVVMPPKERAEVLVLAVVLVNPKESICDESIVVIDRS